MNTEEELITILNRYQKDSQERQDLLRVHRLGAQGVSLESQSETEDTAGLNQYIAESVAEQNQYTFIVPDVTDVVDVDAIVQTLNECVEHGFSLRIDDFTEAETGALSKVNWTSGGPYSGFDWGNVWRKSCFGKLFSAPVGSVILKREPRQTKDRVFIVLPAGEDGGYWSEVVADGMKPTGLGL